MKKRIYNIIMAAISLAAFIVFTYLVKHYDVAAIGPNATSVGFSSFNKQFADAVGTSQLWYELTNVIGWIAVMICAVFAVIGFIQLVKTRSLKKVDSDIISLGILYALCVAIYVIFDRVAINYRPVLENGVLESSYPSSHTVLAICVFASLIIEINRRITNPSKALIEKIGCLAMICILIFGRMLSGMHWITDIIGGVILSQAFLFIYKATLRDC